MLMLSKYAQIGGTPHGENIAVAGEQPMFTDSYCMCKARCVYILCSILVLVYIVTVGCNPHPHNPFTPTPTLFFSHMHTTYVPTWRGGGVEERLLIPAVLAVQISRGERVVRGL